MSEQLNRANIELQEKLSEGNNRLQTVNAFLNFAPDAMVIINQQNQIILVNAQAEKLFGYTQDELLNQAIEVLIPEKFHSRHERHRKSYIDNSHPRGMGVGLELRALRKDGSEFPVEISLSSTSINKITYIIAAIRDTTTRDVQEQLLRFHASLQETVQEAVIATDLDFRIQSWNSAAETIYGWRAEEVIGKNSFEVLETPHKSAQARQDMLNTLIKQGYWEGEFLQHTKDGNEVYILGSTTLFKDKHDKPIGIVSVNHDITHRKQIEKALHESEVQYRVLFDQIEDSIFVHDKESNILDVNQAACDRLGYSRDELLKMKTIDIDLPEYGAKFNERLEHQLTTGKLLDINGIHITKDGRQIPLHIHSRRIMYKGQVAVIAVARDISELMQAEQQERELAIQRERVKLLADFVKDISHDFRTPLASIGTSTYLLNKTPDTTKRQHYVDVIVYQIEQITHLIDRLLLMARLDGTPELEFESVNLTIIIHDLAEIFTDIAQKKHVTINLDLPEALPNIQANAREMSLAIREIIDNAIMFTPAGGTVSIRTEITNNTLIITIADTGEGILPQDLPRIFQRLYRGDQARQMEQQRHGLGLSIAKRIIELHDGTIEVNSLVGEGSSFQVILPF